MTKSQPQTLNFKCDLYLDVSGVIQLITSPLIFLKAALLCSISQTQDRLKSALNLCPAL